MSPETAPQPSQTKPSFLARWEDRLSGFDFFICYRWSDGRKYAERVATHLSKKYKVFFDTTEYALGDSLSEEGNRALRKTSVLVFLATPDAINSEHIRRELSVFLDTNQRFVVLNVCKAVNAWIIDHRLERLASPDQLTLEIDANDFLTGPTEHVLSAVEKTLTVITSKQQRRKAIKQTLLGFIGLTVLLLIAGTISWNYYRYKQSEYFLNDLGAKISSTQPGQITIDGFENPPKIRLDQDVLVPHLQRLVTPTELHLLNQTVRNVNTIGQLHSLRVVNLFGSSGVDSLQFANSLPHLERLLLNGAGISDEILSSLGPSSELKELILVNNPITAAVVPHLLEAHPMLQRMSVNRCSTLVLNEGACRALIRHCRTLNKLGVHFLLQIDRSSIPDDMAVTRLLNELEGAGNDVSVSSLSTLESSGGV